MSRISSIEVQRVSLTGNKPVQRSFHKFKEFVSWLVDLFEKKRPGFYSITFVINEKYEV